MMFRGLLLGREKPFMFLHRAQMCSVDHEHRQVSVDNNRVCMTHSGSSKLYLSDQVPFSSTISIGLLSSRDLRPASRIAPVAIVFFSVGNGR